MQIASGSFFLQVFIFISQKNDDNAICNSQQKVFVHCAPCGFSSHRKQHNYPDRSPKETCSHPSLKMQGVLVFSVSVWWQQWVHLWEVCPGRRAGQLGVKASGESGQVEEHQGVREGLVQPYSTVLKTDTSASYNTRSKCPLHSHQQAAGGKLRDREEWKQVLALGGMQIPFLPNSPSQLPSHNR